ncbi:hypothetical protein NPIL_51201 [Nephila pilipes]|uniref:Uncharacterized protein n=1 Tax=Nephila pilipes TaxID=299642 RepID=A0A8X6PJE8_NEPPI|nr:hypothetical protein NPIL_51201 [Nephila pilipes]
MKTSIKKPKSPRGKASKCSGHAIHVASLSVRKSSHVVGRALWEISTSPTDGAVADIARCYSLERERERERYSEVREQVTSPNLQLPRRECLVNVHADHQKAIRIKDYLTCEEWHSESPTLKTIICILIFQNRI